MQPGGQEHQLDLTADVRGSAVPQLVQREWTADWWEDFKIEQPRAGRPDVGGAEQPEAAVYSAFRASDNPVQLSALGAC